MKKLSIILISLSILPIFGNSLYVIKNNDTLYSIARDNNIAIKDLFSANKEIGLNPDFIRPGDSIYLPDNDNPYRKICSPAGFTYGFYTLENIEKTDCIDFIEDNLDIKIFDYGSPNSEGFWSKFFSDVGYAYYLIYKYEEKITNSTNSDDLEKYTNFINEAIRRGSEVTIYFAYNNSDAFPGFKDMHPYADVMSSNPKRNLKDFCEINKSNILSIKNFNLKTHISDNCSNLFYREGEISKALEYDNVIYESYMNYDSSIVDDNILANLTNLIFRWINIERGSDAVFLTENFINTTCKNCSSYETNFTSNLMTANYYNAWIDFHNNKEPVNMYIWYALHLMGLNYSAQIYKEDSSISTDQMISDREHSLMLINEDINYVGDSSAYLLEALEESKLYYNSDTGLKLLNRGECELAKKFLDPVFNQYKANIEDFGDFSGDDIFSEPLLLINCFANNELELNYDFYIDYVNQAQEDLNSQRSIFNLLIESISLLVNQKNSSNLNKDNLVTLIMDVFLYAETSLNLQEIGIFEVLILNLYKLASVFDDIEIYSDIFDINNMKQNLLNENKFFNTLSDSSDIKNKVKSNQLMIQQISSKESFTQQDYEQMMGLIQENKDLLNSNIKSNPITSKYYLNDLKLKSLMNKLDDNEYVFQFILSDYDVGIVQVISSDNISI